MWFRNLRIYRLTGPFELSGPALAEKLAHNAFRPCARLESSTLGWVAPMKTAAPLVHEANGCFMVCLRKEEKVLPASVVNEFVEEKAAEIEARQARPVRRKERQALREEVLQELLPRAFARSSLTHAYVAPQTGLICVDAASANRAEELLSLLRRSLGSLPARAPALQVAPPAVMTRWLAGLDVPAGFVLDDECELREPAEDGGVVRCKRQDLSAEEIQAHLQAGKQAVKLAISWEDAVSCLLDEELAVKRLRFSNAILEQAELEDADEQARFEADFALMTVELARFIPRLLEAFGGEDEAAYRPAPQALAV